MTGNEKRAPCNRALTASSAHNGTGMSLCHFEQSEAQSRNLLLFMRATPHLSNSERFLDFARNDKADERAKENE